MGDGFDSLNVYFNLQQLTAKSPEELCELIRQIKTPIKIHAIVATNSRYTAFISGDVRIKRIRKDN